MLLHWSEQGVLADSGDHEWGVEQAALAIDQRAVIAMDVKTLIARRAPSSKRICAPTPGIRGSDARVG